MQLSASSLFEPLSSVVTFAGAQPTGTVYIGYLRMAGLDDEGTLAALLSAVQYANEAAYVWGLRFEAKVTSIPCGNFTVCANLPPAMEAAYVAPFLASMGDMTAVFKPNYLLANIVIDRANDLGGLPVLAPLTVRGADFGNGTDHIVHFEQYVRSGIVHLFTYMQQADGCALAGIMYEEFSEMPQHVAYAQSLFTGGGMPEPPALNLNTATDDDLFAFLSADKRRQCFIVIATHSHVKALGSRLSDPRFANSSEVPHLLHLYGTSLTAGTNFADPVGGTAPFANMHFVKWSPSFVGGRFFHAAVDMSERLMHWLNGGAAATGSISAADKALFIDGMDVVPTGPSDGTLEGYLIAMFLIDSVRVAAAADYASIDVTVPVSLPWRSLVDSFYNYPHTIGNYPFDRMRRFCPPLPLQQVCFCNTATFTSYVYRVNASHPDGKPYVIFDDASLGQRDVASLQLTDGCSMNVSSRSYPLTSLLFTVSKDYVPPAGTTALDSRLDKQAMVGASINSRVIAANLAPVAPARPYRFATIGVSNGHSTQVMEETGVQYAPFIVIGSAETIIEKADVLTLLPALLQQRVEDPVLAPPGEWQHTIFNMIPVLADYIHALASYYHDNREAFTGFHALATTQLEAQLISKSMATFGYDIPAASIITGSTAGLWEGAMEAWFSSESAPYVLTTTSTSNANLAALFRIANRYPTRGRVGIACSAVFLNTYYKSVTLTGDADVFFSTSFVDWWMPEKLAGLSASDQLIALDPLYWFAQAAADITVQLSQRAQFDFRSNAADLAYEISVFSSGGNSYGPISNKPCTAAQIAANTRDRDCQCTKGPRTMHVLSLQGWQRRTSSRPRTGGYSYYIASCGVVYKPYVPPPADNSLSTGSIAGIAVGAAAALIGLLVAFVLINVCCFGRNNRAAPADPSRAFTIVFTDIQSSTALWSRAPSAMSGAVEQHHAIMRKALNKNNGYEVKTIGDSFMIAFKDVNDAVRFGIVVQSALFEADWHSEIDAVYYELIMEAEAAAAEAAGTATHGGSSQAGGGGGESNTNNNNNFHPYTVDAFTPTRRKSEMDASVNFNDNTVSKSVMPPVSPLMVPTAASATGAASAAGNAPSAGGRQPSTSFQIPAPGQTVVPNFVGIAGSSQHVSGFAGGDNAPLKSRDTNVSVLLSHECWHGIRVRIGINYGMGEPRKDPVTHGYDYYGTVVNTAARVEGVGHGGQTLLTADVVNAMDPDVIRRAGAVAVSLGPQPLRGLDGPIVLTQVVPQPLSARRFPALRLHIEVDVTEESNTETTNGSQSDMTALGPAELAAQLCAQRQYSGLVTVDELLANLNVIQTVFGPTKPKWQQEAIAKIGESWGFEKAAKAARREGSRLRLLVTLMGKVSKAINMRRSSGGGAYRGGAGGNNRSNYSESILVQRSMATGVASGAVPTGFNHNNNNSNSNANGGSMGQGPVVVGPNGMVQRRNSASRSGAFNVDALSQMMMTPSQVNNSNANSNGNTPNHHAAGAISSGGVVPFDGASMSMGVAGNQSASSPLGAAAFANGAFAARMASNGHSSSFSRGPSGGQYVGINAANIPPLTVVSVGNVGSNSQLAAIMATEADLPIGSMISPPSTSNNL